MSTKSKYKCHKKQDVPLYKAPRCNSNCGKRHPKNCERSLITGSCSYKKCKYCHSDGPIQKDFKAMKKEIDSLKNDISDCENTIKRLSGKVNDILIRLKNDKDDTLLKLIQWRVKK